MIRIMARIDTGLDLSSWHFDVRLRLVEDRFPRIRCSMRRLLKKWQLETAFFALR